MKYRVMTVPGFCFLMLTAAGCQVVETTAYISPTPTPLPDPHGHVVDVSQTGLSPESNADFVITKVSLDPSLERENAIENPGGTFQAFTVCDPTLCLGENCCRDRIFIEDVEVGQVYEIQGLPLPWRSFTDIVWINDRILVFDRWSSPNYGIHYAVDVRESELLLASPFPGQLPATR